MLILAALALLASPQGEPITRVAFGSCLKTERSPLVLESIREWQPELFVMLGDNVYADTEDMALMRAKFGELSALESFAALRASCTLLATWDDHDYGVNDGGAEYPRRAEAQQVFLDFCAEPADSERRRSAGVYAARLFGPAGKRLQVLLLDTRYFRSPLELREPRGERSDPAFGTPGNYRPSSDPLRTLLGEEQWTWLEARLREPAEVRLIASSIQFVAQDHGFETWANLPLERRRLLELVRETGAGGVVFVSGDRHLAELSILAAEDEANAAGYPIADLTASSFNAPSSWWNERNRHRVGSKFHDANFGTLELDWTSAIPLLTLRIHREDGRVVLRHELLLEDLQPRD